MANYDRANSPKFDLTLRVLQARSMLGMRMHARTGPAPAGCACARAAAAAADAPRFPSPRARRPWPTTTRSA